MRLCGACDADLAAHAIVANVTGRACRLASGGIARPVFEPASPDRRNHMLHHRRFTGSELTEVGSPLSKGDAMVRPGFRVEGVQILAIILPEADRADEVVSALRQRDEIAAWA